VPSTRNRRRSSHIPALCNENSDLVYNHEGMASLLSTQFFSEEGTPIPTSFEDDPAPRETREFLPFGESELSSLLRVTANKSAPGSSGIGWNLLKKGWEAVKDHLISTYNACLILGHHPAQWKEAKVVAIPKPDKLDYSLPKAHRPISLLETMSKLLEKAVAKRMQHNIIKHKLIHANQFGGRAHSSCLDAGLALIHDIQDAHRRGLKVGILLFDVRGFFNNVNHGRMTAILENLGYPPELVRWSEAFLQNRKVCLSFNNVISEERGQPIGVPQGSPLSPVYSITYTSSLLAKMREWYNSSLGMYVDDGILFAASEEWGDVERLLAARYTVCEEWLRRSGLAIEPDKMELLFFQKPYERNAVPAPTRLVLPDLTISSYYVVRPVENLRYLGFFINRRLKWEPHVWIMCNWARTSIKALQVLGNTIRGLSMANWWLVLNAVCLPVLTYESQLWSLTGAAKGLINMVQRVQNDMVRQVTGAFRTAPREPLLHFTRMLPMKFFIEKLTYTSALCLYRLPRESQLLRRLGTDWYSPGQGDLPLPVPRSRVLRGKRNQHPTALEALALKVPSGGPKVDVVALAPWEVPNWVEHVSYMGVENPCV
jgi:retron-type reverse transcriptase